MCGIVAYIGNKHIASEVILKGLQRLEYRGYDSAGLATIQNQQLLVAKKAGKVIDLAQIVKESPEISSTPIGIGHTRWATHGEPNDHNAHPHIANNGKLAIIHNGIIENYDSLKKELTKFGYTFQSETDTEVLINFIQLLQEQEKCDLKDAVIYALRRVTGAYAIVILDQEHPDTLIAARKGSPMVLGVGDHFHIVASDATPIIEYTNQVIYLNDEEIAVVKADTHQLFSIDKKTQRPTIHHIDMDLEAIEKGGFEYFMEKEIFEQPESIRNTLRGRIRIESREIVLGGIHQYAKALIQAKKITMLGCGTSWHAGLVSEYLFEDICRIPVEVEYASEFRYRNPIIHEGDIFIAISQSGETADTLAAIELAKSKGAIVFGVVNSVGSSIARLTDEGAYLHAGPEIGVASTKAFTSQVTLLTMIAIKVGFLRGTVNQDRYHGLMIGLFQLPELIKKVLESKDHIYHIAEKLFQSTNMLFLGRGNNFPVALEGALKLKEISYIHAEGYPAAEMKHGPIALIDENMPAVFIALKDDSYEKVISNMQEVKARKGKIIAIVTEGDTQAKEIADFVIAIPAIDSVLAPILAVIPLQLLSYKIALLRGCNVDQPRNLAKSVTVE